MKTRLKSALAGMVFRIVPPGAKRILLLTSVYAYVSKVCFDKDVYEDNKSLSRFAKGMNLTDCIDMLKFPALAYEAILSTASNKVLKAMSKDNCIMLDDFSKAKDEKISVVCIARAAEFAEGIVRGLPNYQLYGRRTDVVKELVKLIVNTDYFIGLTQGDKPLDVTCEKQWKVA